MNLVWRHGHCSVRDLVNDLNLIKPVAYTTVLTVIQRLHEKGLVAKRADQKAFVYSARVSKETYSKTLAQSFLKKFIHSFGEIGIASFAHSIDSLSEDERQRLLDLLQHDKTHKP